MPLDKKIMSEIQSGFKGLGTFMAKRKETWLMNIYDVTKMPFRIPTRTMN